MKQQSAGTVERDNPLGELLEFCRPDFFTTLRLNCASVQIVCLGLEPPGSGITSSIWTSLKVSSTSLPPSLRTAERAPSVTADPLLLGIHLTFATRRIHRNALLHRGRSVRCGGTMTKRPITIKYATCTSDVNLNSRLLLIDDNRRALYSLLQLASS